MPELGTPRRDGDTRGERPRWRGADGTAHCWSPLEGPTWSKGGDVPTHSLGQPGPKNPPRGALVTSRCPVLCRVRGWSPPGHRALGAGPPRAAPSPTPSSLHPPSRIRGAFRARRRASTRRHPRARGHIQRVGALRGPRRSRARLARPGEPGWGWGRASVPAGGTKLGLATAPRCQSPARPSCRHRREQQRRPHAALVGRRRKSESEGGRPARPRRRRRDASARITFLQVAPRTPRAPPASPPRSPLGAGLGEDGAPPDAAAPSRLCHPTGAAVAPVPKSV